MFIETLLQNPEDVEVLKALPKYARPYYGAQRRVGMSIPDANSLKLYKIFKKVALIVSLLPIPYFIIMLVLDDSFLRSNVNAEHTWLQLYAHNQFDDYWNSLMMIMDIILIPVMYSLLINDISREIFCPFSGAFNRWFVLWFCLGISLSAVVVGILMAMIIHSRQYDHDVYIRCGEENHIKIRQDYKRFVKEEKKQKKAYSKLTIDALHQLYIV